MSYMRAGWPMKYVKGDSKDYVFLSSASDHEDWIEDYDKLSNGGLVEMFARWFETKEDDEKQLFKKYMLKQLAEKLDVELRKKPLTVDQIFKGMEKNVEKHQSEMQQD